MIEIAAIIQCRLGSTRLPRKIFLDLNGKPVIKHVVERIKKSKKIKKIIIATTLEPEDDEICKWCEKESLDYFRGDNKDVLSRFYHCANHFKVSKIVRVTSDCPLIDPEIIDKTIELFTNEKSDYASNNLEKTFPHGFDTEIFSFKSLETAYLNSTSEIEKEHVTQFIRKRPREFKLSNLSSKRNLSGIRVTIDEKEDLILMKKIFETLGNEAYYKDLESLFIKSPQLKKLNENAKSRHNNYNEEKEII